MQHVMSEDKQPVGHLILPVKKKSQWPICVNTHQLIIQFVKSSLPFVGSNISEMSLGKSSTEEEEQKYSNSAKVNCNQTLITPGENTHIQMDRT